MPIRYKPIVIKKNDKIVSNFALFLKMKAYVRIHQIKLPPKSSGLEATVATQPSGNEITAECSGSPMTCYKIFQLDCQDQFEKEGSIEITLKKKKLIGSSEPLEVLVLPFKWFELNKTIRSNFPCKSLTSRVYDTSMDVEVHISSTSCKPFDAPTGQLQCIPQWQIDSQNLNQPAPVPAKPAPQHTQEPTYVPPPPPAYEPTPQSTPYSQNQPYPQNAPYPQNPVPQGQAPQYDPYLNPYAENQASNTPVSGASVNPYDEPPNPYESPI